MSLRRSTRDLLVATALALACAAPDTGPAPTAAHPTVASARVVVTCAEGPRPLLWRARGPNATVYLYGSIHFGRPDFYPLPAAVEQAFSGAARLVVEVDPRSAESQHQLAASLATAMLPDSGTLSDVLEPEVYAELHDAFAQIGVPLAPLEPLEPWAVALTLAMFKTQSLGLRTDLGIDTHLLSRAGSREVVELETIKEQLDLFASLGGNDFLRYTLRSLDTLDADVGQLVEAWRCGDEDALEALLLTEPGEQLPDADALLDRMFYDRNRKMASRIDETLREGDSFVVVGAGHLVGELGVPALLARAGWELTRLGAQPGSR